MKWGFIMLKAGIVGQSGIRDTASLVSSILSSTGKKVSVVDSAKLENLDSKRLKSYLHELSKNNVDILVFKINIRDVNWVILENINFDIMIYTDKADDLKECANNGYTSIMRKVISMLDEKGLAIVNADDDELIGFLNEMKQSIVTYGFNSEASITTSSIGDTIFDDKIMCSLQRTISTKNGSLIEPQEYVIKVENREMDSYNVLAAATFAIINGVDLNSIGYTTT